MDNSERTEGNSRNQDLEYILTTINNVLEDDENELISSFIKPEYPPVFIVGCARSGTTLLYQWLASTGHFSYPSNIISRFYKAPYIGALIHKAFVDFDKFGEIFGKESINFNSTLGKTKSAVSPHEFWYFWRRFFNFGEIQKISDEELFKIDSKTFLKELAAIERAFDKPLLMKGMIINWNLEYLRKLMPNAIFIHLRREPLYNMHSLFNARLKFFGNVENWYSFKPPEYEILKSKNVYEQLAGQVYYTDRAILNALVGTKSVISINYEDLIIDPKTMHKKITDKMVDFGCALEQDKYEGPSNFSTSNEITNELFDVKKSIEAISIYR